MNTFLYTKTAVSCVKILYLFIGEENLKNIDQLKFIKTFFDTLSEEMNNYNGIETLISTCNLFQISINSEFLLLLSQLVLFESYSYSILHNGFFYIRTLSFMKSEPFYMDKIGKYINNFYQLEFNNEKDERVRLLYP